MVPTIIQILIIFILGVLVGGFLPRSHPSPERKKKVPQLKEPSLIARQREKKDANKKRILSAFAAMPEGKLTNFDLEILLDVSDATAARYLDELEKEGQIRQVGSVGPQVYYQRTSN